MTETEARRRVRQQLVDHLTTAVRNVGEYADTYVRSVLENPRKVNVRPPKGLHPNLAAMVRDIALDVLMAEPVVATSAETTVETCPTA